MTLLDGQRLAWHVYLLLATLNKELPLKRERQVSQEDIDMIGYAMDDVHDHCTCLVRMVLTGDYDKAHAQWIKDWMFSEFDPILVKHFYPHIEGYDILQSTRDSATRYAKWREDVRKSIAESIRSLTL